MIKDLAKTIVKERYMNSAIDSVEKHSDYLISLYETKLLLHLANSKAYTCYEPKTIAKLNDELQFIKDNHSRELLLIECSKLLLMKSLEEIL